MADWEMPVDPRHRTGCKPGGCCSWTECDGHPNAKPTTGLTSEEREALRDWWDSESDSDTAGTMLANLDATVERILAARMAVAWDEGKWAAYNVERDGGDGSGAPNPYRPGGDV